MSPIVSRIDLEDTLEELGITKDQRIRTLFDALDDMLDAEDNDDFDDEDDED